jgi:transposase
MSQHCKCFANIQSRIGEWDVQANAMDRFQFLWPVISVAEGKDQNHPKKSQRNQALKDLKFEAADWKAG